MIYLLTFTYILTNKEIEASRRKLIISINWCFSSEFVLSIVQSIFFFWKLIIIYFIILYFYRLFWNNYIYTWFSNYTAHRYSNLQNNFCFLLLHSEITILQCNKFIGWFEKPLSLRRIKNTVMMYCRCCPSFWQVWHHRLIQKISKQTDTSYLNLSQEPPVFLFSIKWNWSPTYSRFKRTHESVLYTLYTSMHCIIMYKKKKISTLAENK